MVVDPQIDAWKFFVVIDQDRGGTLAAVLAACVASGFNRAHQAIFEIGAWVLVISGFNSVQDVFAQQNIAEGDKIIANVMARPIAVLPAGARGGKTVVIDHAELAVFAIRVALD